MKKNIFKKVTSYILVFVFFFTIIFSVHLTKKGFWSSDDPYYHAKHSQLMAQTGNLILVEPWMPFHFLGYAPTDPWWGFHVLSALFIHFFGVFTGVKFFVSILSALIFSTYYFIIRDLKISRPFVWTLLFFSSSAFFQYRIFLERPLLLALFILPLSVWLIYRQKYFCLFVLSVIFALLYNLAPLILFTAVMYFLVEFYLEKKFNLRPVLATAGGVLVGIFLHPQSFNYLYVMFMHLWQVLYLRFAGVNLSIGGEVQLKNFFGFVSENVIVLLFFLITWAMFFSFSELRKNKLTVSLFSISSFWFLVSVLVPRAVDFWLPFAWLFIAMIFPAFARLPEFVLFKKVINSRINTKVLLILLLPVFLIIVGYNFFQIYNYIYTTNHSNDQDVYYEQAGAWLKQHTEPGEMIFYNDWGLWPRMFFNDDYNRYVTGMDPTFLYEYDPSLYWLWNNISYNGIYCDQADGCLMSNPKQRLAGIKPAIKQRFGANYVLLGNSKESKLKKVLDNRRQDFAKVYENQALVIYQLK